MKTLTIFSVLILCSSLVSSPAWAIARFGFHAGFDMSSQDALANLLRPQHGKMRQVSSQGAQPLAPYMEAVMPGEPNKMVAVQPGESLTLADIPAQAPSYGSG